MTSTAHDWGSLPSPRRIQCTRGVHFLREEPVVGTGFALAEAVRDGDQVEEVRDGVVLGNRMRTEKALVLAFPTIVGFCPATPTIPRRTTTLPRVATDIVVDGMRSRQQVLKKRDGC